MDPRSTYRIVVGTRKGLHWIDEGEPPGEALDGRDVLALAREGRTWWAIVDGHELWRTRDDSPFEEAARSSRYDLTCLAPTSAGLLVGTTGAHLLRVEDGALERVESFESAEGRGEWYTPWGGPADTRSIAADATGSIYVNVHVGGVARSTDGGRSFAPTLDIERDVHQVLAHPTRPGVVLAAAAVGCGRSDDGGGSWRFEVDGLHANYLRAVAVAKDTLLVSASTGPSGQNSSIYRRPFDGSRPFERCREGLPQWFARNVDTGCLVAAGDVVACAVDGAVYRSDDRGQSWERIVEGLPTIRCVALV